MSSSHHLRVLPSKWDIEAWLLWAWISIVTSFNSALLRQRRRVQGRISARGKSSSITTIVTSTGHDNSILPSRDIQFNRHISVWTTFLRVNGDQSAVRGLTNNGKILPFNRQDWEVRRSWQTIYKSPQLRLHSIQLSEVLQRQWACTPTALATSTKHTCAGIRRPLTPTEEDQPMQEALVLPRMCARAKCTYRNSPHDGSTSTPWTRLQRRWINAWGRIHYSSDVYLCR